MRVGTMPSSVGRTAEVEPGCIVSIDRVAYRVTANAEALAPPVEWSPHYRQGARFWQLVRLADGEKGSVTVPGYTYDRRVQILAAPDHDGHYPTCSECGQPWPCQQRDDAATAAIGADQAVAVFEHEMANPWPCAWCARFSTVRTRRFKTERGLKAHISRGRCHNPAKWDPSSWVLTFNDDIRIVGGCQATEYAWESMQSFAGALGGARSPGSLAEAQAVMGAVRDAALDGSLPSRLADVEVPR